mmetsp:Transcript_32729/g.76093  ORF Transcript_32729/g.76093 Transcript_32729/m.76093 type:complete len:308 (+) Transcript_32729:38-961(+)|eukprot:CAMPEP_0171078708 /NCGR_PEP_ID=MMETSP0766_2-20121228/14799_1 /TAXON_ID=439317 /ORGANISM="Gambierdiscus australes, Strain CAWD 149" /LENGTH=307 /DNA_ID=CAMNT_0011535853 /DNA_START=26 /DNA_END=949 /DNA_ORIENTATION=-
MLAPAVDARLARERVATATSSATLRSLALVLPNGLAGGALCSGLAGMCAQVVNVLSLMWMRTIVMVQFRHGGGVVQVAAGLWREGGVRRFYRGMAPALFLAPASRFCDTAVNDATLASLAKTELPLSVKTLASSVCAASFRTLLLPLDTLTSMKQVEGKDGFERLLKKMRSHPSAPWQGASAAIGAASLGHYMWFYTSNKLFSATHFLEPRLGKNTRSLMVGCCSGAVTDLVTNSFWVLKTMRQTSPTVISYTEAARQVIRTDGIGGIVGRGLKLRMITNSVQGGLFAVSWKAIDGILRNNLGMTPA